VQYFRRFTNRMLVLSQRAQIKSTKNRWNFCLGRRKIDKFVIANVRGEVANCDVIFEGGLNTCDEMWQGVGGDRFIVTLFMDDPFRLEKNFSAWDHGFFVDVHILRGCLCIFVYNWIMTSYTGSRTIHQILWLEVFLDFRLQYRSLEGLIDFLAFLVQ